MALLSANSLFYVNLVHALTRLGAILVPLNLRLSLQELCWQLRDVHASFLICDADNALQPMKSDKHHLNYLSLRWQPFRTKAKRY